jgi:hypothetical protein
MGAPTSEVGYTSATTRRGDHEVYKDMWWHWEKVLQSKNFKIKIYLYKHITLRDVLYGCETWSLTLREERRLGVFENRVLRRIFGCKWNGVTGKWRKIHNEELNGLNCTPNIVRAIKSRKWAGHVARMVEGIGGYKVLDG